MDKQLKQLKILEKYPNKTCIIKRADHIVFTSEAKGVKPMIDYYDIHGASEEPLMIIDRIMGKGAVILADLIGATIIATPIISDIALECAKDKELSVYYEKVVPYIVNRDGDGRCPIETAVEDINDTRQGYTRICKVLDALRVQGRTK